MGNILFIKVVAFVLLLLSCIASYPRPKPFVAQADDSVSPPAIDMGALGNLASNLGSNPQIMGLLSNFLNIGSPDIKPALGLSSSNVASGQDMDSNLATQENLIVGNLQESNNEPLRRGLRTSEQSVQPQPNILSPTSIPVASTQPSSANQPVSSLSGLMSMLPGVLSSLSNGNGGSNSLSGLTTLLSRVTSSPGNAGLVSSLPDPNSQVSINSAVATTASPIPTAPVAAAVAPIGNSAQSVINQVLTAYASGQIPNELIQLGLSGRVPPQIIELALSGQVPPRIIQMVITGQVPLSTINAFLNTIQASRSNPSTSDIGPNSNIAGRTSSPGVFATTRAIFEALFNLVRRTTVGQSTNARSGLTVPTLLGPVALRMPSIPNMRSIGKLVGGTITNISSLIPF